MVRHDHLLEILVVSVLDKILELLERDLYDCIKVRERCKLGIWKELADSRPGLGTDVSLYDVTECLSSLVQKRMEMIRTGSRRINML